MSRRTRAEPLALRHVLVAGGTSADWWSMTSEAWNVRLAMLADQASSGGAAWLTVRPFGPGGPVPLPAGEPPWPQEPTVVGGVTVVVDAEADARGRMATVLARLVADHVRPEAVTDDLLAAAFAHPAPDEPDLAVLLGPDDTLPASLSWELAYAEVVFIDAAWNDVDPIVVKAAVAEYFTRNRRFGAVP